MKRREFIAALGGAAAWPLAARAQRERRRRVGVLDTLTPHDAYGQERVHAFVQALQQAGWAIGHNLSVETRWGAGSEELLRKYAKELVALSPDVILATGTPALGPLLQLTREV